MADTSGTYTLTGLLFSTVTANAAANQNPTGAVTYNLTGVLSDFIIASAVNSTVIVNQTVSIGDTVNVFTNGGTISAGTGLLLDTVNATISGGGSYIAGSGTGVLSLLNGTGSVTFSGTGGVLTVGQSGVSAAVSETTPIAGFKSGADKIDDLSLNFGGITGYTISGTPAGFQTITVNDASGSFTFKTQNAGLADGSYTSLTTGPLKLSADGLGGTVIAAVCFLAGTRLATPGGETEVEALAEGDLVAVREDGETVFRPVTWIGRRRMDVSRAGGRIEAYPVRIRADAFAPGVPRRDLLVTSEHCVLADGRLIPARMLVNGGSIIVDVAVDQYEYFHVELERHAILIAEGLEAESYLDTGNRGNFANAPVPALRADFGVDPAQDAWAGRAAAPLAVDRATVEPVWRRLADRARTLGLTTPGLGAPAEAALTGEPDLRIVTESGIEIRPSLRDGATYAFVVPAGARGLRLASRAARPSDVVGPFVDDRRTLGVKVGRIGLGVGRRRVAIEAADCGGLPGWHAAEPGSASRWTDGDAALPLDLSAWDGAPVFLDVEITAAGPFPAEAPAALAA